VSGQVEIQTRPCIMCGKTSFISVDADGYRMWQAGALIQVAMPHVSPQDREMLINGTHPECWDIMTTTEDEEDDDDEYIDEDALHDRD
jgi:hypothetical protein